MASIYELAVLSEMTYDSTRLAFTGWRRIDQYGDTSGRGFYAELYASSNRKEVVMAIRGTDAGNEDESEDWSDLLSNIQIGLGQTPLQLKYAGKAYKRFMLKIKLQLGEEYNVYLTGHSLGGGLASLLSAKNSGLPTVTFNAPGMQRSYIGGHLIDIIGYINLRSVDTSQMVHVRATGDVVSLAAGKHMGKVQDVYVDYWGDGKIIGASRHLAQHSIGNMVSTLQQRFMFHKDMAFKTKQV